jgi:hypothetical protein
MWPLASSDTTLVIRSEVYGVGVTDEINNQSTTPTLKRFVSGLSSLVIGFGDMGSAAGKAVYVVFDALDDADAATKLDVAASRETVFLGERRSFQFGAATPCYRVDVKSHTVETGASKIAFSGKTLV